MNKIVNVLISTYNGEEYIKEQIESVSGLLESTSSLPMATARKDGLGIWECGWWCK